MNTTAQPQFLAQFNEDACGNIAIIWMARQKHVKIATWVRRPTQMEHKLAS